MVAIDEERARSATITLAERLSDLPLHEMAMTAIDMPIGLDDRGGRACDVEARAFLPRAAKSSVFPAPPRGALAFADWKEANRWAKNAHGKGISLQSWHLTAKIRELDALLTPARQARIREAHPELAFLSRNGHRPLPSKKSSDGRRSRQALLSAHGFTSLDRLIAAVPRAGARPDDVLDAAILALVARDIARCAAHRAPAMERAAERDVRGLAMEIWF